MPKLIRLYITHCAIGFAISAAFVSMLLWFNIANLWHLVSHSPSGILAVLVLWVSNGIVFAGVQFAIAVMRLKDDDTGPRSGKRQPVATLEPAMVRAQAPARSGDRFQKRQ
ncbi:hypothetical protein A9Q95_04105 [Rhodobacterales bacterium 59_46_T64]|nr:hypothetical protein A9Q95_04105 [Rhodobacterales bacterium 59_46_T64]